MTSPGEVLELIHATTRRFHTARAVGRTGEKTHGETPVVQQVKLGISGIKG